MLRVYSLKTGSKFGRSRGYWESDTFGHCNLSAVPAWTAGADVDDDMMVGTSKKQTAQLYNVRRLSSASFAAADRQCVCAGVLVGRCGVREPDAVSAKHLLAGLREQSRPATAAYLWGRAGDGGARLRPDQPTASGVYGSLPWVQQVSVLTCKLSWCTRQRLACCCAQRRFSLLEATGASPADCSVRSTGWFVELRECTLSVRLLLSLTNAVCRETSNLSLAGSWCSTTLSVCTSAGALRGAGTVRW